MTFKNKQLEFGSFRADLANHLLLRGEKPVPLAPKAYDTLIYLLENPNRLITREELMKAVWPDSFVEDGNVSVNIFQLRKALGEMSDGSDYIQTVPRRGYRFRADVKVVEEKSRLGPPDAPYEVESPEAPHSLPGKASLPYAPPMRAAGPGNEAVARKANLPDVITFPERREKEVDRVPPVGSPSAVGGVTSWALRFGIFAVVVIVLLGVWLVWRPNLMPRQLSERRMTSFAPEMAVTAACISTGAKFIAYANPAGLFVQVIATGQTHSIELPKHGFEVSGISWFPDSASLLVGGSSPGDASPSLWLVPVIGTGAPVKLGSYRDGAVSPDGSKIAIVDSSGPSPMLKIARSDGTDERTVVTGEQGETFGSAAWGDQGARVIFVRYRWDAQFRQNSGSIAFYDLKSGKMGNVVSGMGFSGSVVSLHDGRIVYTMMPRANPVSRGSALMAVKTDPKTGKAAGPPALLAKWAGPVTGLSVNTSGNLLVLRDLVVEHDIYVAELKNGGNGLGQIRRMSFGSGRDDFPRSWTPDGKFIFFDTNRNGNWQIFKLSLAGGPETSLVEGPEDQFTPRPSPDAKWLLYLERPKDWSEHQPVNVMRIPISGGRPEQVLKDAGISAWGMRFQCPHVSGWPCLLAARTGEDIVFRAFEPVKGFVSPASEITIHQMGAGFDWSLAPDGSKLAWISSDSSAGIHVVSLKKGPNGLVAAAEKLIPVDGWSRMHALSWQSDGNGWFAVSSSEGGWTMLRIDPQGKASVLFTGTGGWAPSIHPSPDGRHLAFSQQSSGSNVWLLRNF